MYKLTNMIDPNRYTFHYSDDKVALEHMAVDLMDTYCGVDWGLVGGYDPDNLQFGVGGSVLVRITETSAMISCATCGNPATHSTRSGEYCDEHPTITLDMVLTALKTHNIGNPHMHLVCLDIGTMALRHRDNPSSFQVFGNLTEVYSWLLEEV